MVEFIITSSITLGELIVAFILILGVGLFLGHFLIDGVNILIRLLQERKNKQ